MEKSPEERSRILVRTLACVLQKLVDVNRKLDTPSTQVITKFHASRPPSISVTDYLERINKYASCSTECLVMALIYIDRLIQQSNFALTALNIHRVIITSIMLAAKFFDDQYFNNLYYAKVGGVPCKEINSLEVEFLFLINFSLHVTEEVYFRYFSELMNHAAYSACPCCSGTIGTTSINNSCCGTTRPTGMAVPAAIPRVPSPVYSYHHHQHHFRQPGVVPVAMGGGGADLSIPVPSSAMGSLGGESGSPVIQPPVTPPAPSDQQQQQPHVIVAAMAAAVQQQHLQLQQQQLQGPATAVLPCGQGESNFTSYFSYEQACNQVNIVDNPQAAHNSLQQAPHHHLQQLQLQQQQQQQQQQQHHRLLYAPVPVIEKLSIPHTYFPAAAAAAAATNEASCVGGASGSTFWDRSAASDNNAVHYSVPLHVDPALGIHLGSSNNNRPLASLLINANTKINNNNNKCNNMDMSSNSNCASKHTEHHSVYPAHHHPTAYPVHINHGGAPLLNYHHHRHHHQQQPHAANSGGTTTNSSSSSSRNSGSSISTRAASLCAQYPSCYGVQVLMHS